MKRIIFLVFMFVSVLSYGQKQNIEIIDSLFKELPHQIQDTNKVKVFVAISSLCYDYSIKSDTGLHYGIMGLQLAEVLNWQRGIAIASSAIGGNYSKLKNYKKSLDFFNKALEIYTNNHNLQAIADCYQDISFVYAAAQDYSNSLSTSRIGIAKYTELNEKKNIIYMYLNIAYVYLEKKMYDSSIYYYEYALDITKVLKDYEQVIAIYNNIGEIYLHQGFYHKALENYFRAKTNISSIDKTFSYTIDGNIGEAYLYIAKDTKHQLEPDSLIPGSRKEILQKAIQYLKKGVEGCIEREDLSGAIEFGKSISDACKISGDYKDALENYKVYATLLDSVIKIENKISINNIEEIHNNEIELKNKDIKMKENELNIDKMELEKKRTNEFFFVVGTILLMIVIGLIYRTYKIQQNSNKLLMIEKKRSDDLLLNILPAEVAEELKKKGFADAKYFDSVTVLFTDFKGFTLFAEKLSPQALVNELDACFKAFDEIIGKYQIEKIKTVGDAYMAVSGLPIANSEHALCIIEAALEIRDFMRERKKILKENTFEIRIGVHTGNVVAGIVGIKKFSYDIWGDTVNTAARMEQNSDVDKINISENTFLLIKDKYNCTYRGKIEAKNKGELKMYYVD